MMQRKFACSRSKDIIVYVVQILVRTYIYIVQLPNDREDQPLRRFMFAIDSVVHMYGAMNAIQIWSSQLEKDKKIIETIQTRSH